MRFASVSTACFRLPMRGGTPPMSGGTPPAAGLAKNWFVRLSGESKPNLAPDGVLLAVRVGSRGASGVELADWFFVMSSGESIRRVVLFAPSARGVIRPEGVLLGIRVGIRGQELIEFTSESVR